MHAWLCFVLCLSWSFATGSPEHAATAIASPDGASIGAEELIEHPARVSPVESKERRGTRSIALGRDVACAASIAAERP